MLLCKCQTKTVIFSSSTLGCRPVEATSGGLALILDYLLPLQRSIQPSPVRLR